MPTTDFAQPARSSLVIRAGSAASEEEVPITMSKSSRTYLITFQSEKPATRAMPPSTTAMKSAQVR